MAPTRPTYQVRQKKYERLPDQNGLLEFSDGENDLVKKMPALRLAMEEVFDLTDDVMTNFTDILVLIDDQVKEARTLYWRGMLNMAGGIVTTPQKIRNLLTGRLEEVYGPEDAMRAFNQRRAKDLTDLAPLPDGEFTENADMAYTDIRQGLAFGNEFRIGFETIDEVVSLERNRFVGLMGFANIGKSTLLYTMAYNLAMQNKNVLFMTIEVPARKVWTKLMFLHSHYFIGEFKLPPIDAWFSKERTVGGEHMRNLRQVVADVTCHKRIPGKIVVKNIYLWTDIEDYLKANEQLHFDVVMIDYLHDLHFPATLRTADIDAERRRTILRAQQLTRTFNDGRGITLITPIQVGREAYKLAKKKEPGTKKFDLTAAHGYSEYEKAMDYIFSVWREMDAAGQPLKSMWVDCQKVRDGSFHRSFAVDIDPNTLYVSEHHDVLSAATLANLEWRGAFGEPLELEDVTAEEYAERCAKHRPDSVEPKSHAQALDAQVKRQAGQPVKYEGSVFEEGPVPQLPDRKMWGS